MKKLNFALLLLSIITVSTALVAQDYQITFAVISGEGYPDSVIVENLSQETNLSIYGKDVLHLIKTETGIENNIRERISLNIFPNPSSEIFFIEFNNPQVGLLSIEVFNVSGKKIIQQINNLPQGLNSYSLSGLAVGTYIVKLTSNSFNASTVLISKTMSYNAPNIVLQNSVINKTTLKSISTPINKVIQMQYNDGEIIKFTGFYKNNYNIKKIIPISSRTIIFTYLNADFIADKTFIAVDSSVTFTDNSTDTPTNWYWDFGDGTTSTLQNPSHVYSVSGSYTVSLIATNDYGASSIEKNDYIIAGNFPSADFITNKTIIAIDSTVIFTDNSTNNPTSWNWDFGDGVTSVKQNPSHIYTTSNNYTVTLTATNVYGSNITKKTNIIDVGQLPNTDFTASITTIAVDSTVIFTDNSTDNPTSWNWVFGDGATSTLQNPSHTYTTLGSYTVNLTTTNKYGSTTKVKTNFITVIPTTITDYDGNIYNIIWIGNQIWMAENLNVTHDVKGNALPYINNDTDWGNLEDNDTSKAYSYANNNLSNASTYGALYSYAAAKDVCPTDWHLPSDAEWSTLELYLTNNGYSGTEGAALKSISGWNGDGNGTDNFNFNALPGGNRRYIGGSTSSLGGAGFWWSITIPQSSMANYRLLESDKVVITSGSHWMSSGFSVRCIRD